MFDDKSIAEGYRQPISTVTAADSNSYLPAIGDRNLILDPVCESDEPFLYRTYASTRTEEMALTGWNAEQQEAFLRMQYEAQRQSYRMHISDAQYLVVRCGKIAVGRLILERTAEEIHIVDIALLTQFRRQGIGSALMEGILREAAEFGKFVRLFVERFNPALRWYEQLGFGVVSAAPIYLEMVWRPGSRRATAVEVSGHADSGVARASMGSCDVSD
jgi:ribosomal protein S18 acetylase RimI-like enzyme